MEELSTSTQQEVNLLLALLAKADNIEARNQLWNLNQRFITKMVLEYYNNHSAAVRRHGYTLDDLMQESYFAFLKAVKREGAFYYVMLPLLLLVPHEENFVHFFTLQMQELSKAYNFTVGEFTFVVYLVQKCLISDSQFLCHKSHCEAGFVQLFLQQFSVYHSRTFLSNAR